MATYKKQLVDKDGNTIIPDVGINLDDVVYSDDPTEEVTDIIDPNSYSLDEKWTGGYWTNGKKIYKRSFTGTVNVPADTLVNTTLWASSTIEDIVDVGGTMGYSPGTGAGRNFLPWAETDTTGTVTNFGMVYLAAASNNLIFRRFSKGQQRDNLPYNIWIEYTKTTDN